MWTRQELKARAKIAFRQNYWKCVVVALILSLLGASTGGGNAGRDAANMNNMPMTTSTTNGTDAYIVSETDQAFAEQYQDTMNYWVNELDQASAAEYPSVLARMISALMGGISIVVIGFALLFAIVLAIAIGVFVVNIFKIGGCQFFVKNAFEITPIGEILGGFRGDRYFSNAITMFLKDLREFLWGLLLIIPGIVKSYEYRMIPYLLAEYPELTPSEAFRLSREMMTGNKWNAFVLDLSFLGWDILGALTLGIVDVFWVAPYKHATNAELYLDLKKNVGLTGGFYPDPQGGAEASQDSWFNPMA